MGWWQAFTARQSHSADSNQQAYLPLANPARSAASLAAAGEPGGERHRYLDATRDHAKLRSSPRPDKVLSAEEEKVASRASGTWTRNRGSGWRFEDGETSKERGDDATTEDDEDDEMWSPASDVALLPPSDRSSPTGGGTRGRLLPIRKRTGLLLGAAFLATVILALSSGDTLRVPSSITGRTGVTRYSLLRGDLLLAPTSSGTDSPRQFQPESCPPEAWSNGSWIPLNPPLSPFATIWDASPDFHNHGCAQNWHRGEWYLGLVPPGSEGQSPENVAGPQGEWPMSRYRRRAAGWIWEPGTEACDNEVELPWYEMSEVVGGEEDEGTIKLLQDLIDRGGWLILGDSLSEGHFMSLSCTLFPHVRAVWPYPAMSEWQQIKEEHLLLSRESPLITAGRLVVPDDWDWDGTPLVSHVRTDHGLAPVELVRVYEDLRASPENRTSRFPELTSPAARANPQPLLTDVETFSPTLDYMLELFLRPAGPRNITTEISPSYGASTTPPDAIELERRTTESAWYRALIFSTGQHFSARHFNLLSTEAHIEYFDLVVATVLDRIADALDSATEDEKRNKEVVVRPTSNGHDECHAAKGPLEIPDRDKSSLYSWKDMWAMNDRAEALVRKVAHPQISWIDVMRPSTLRPDAHTNDDCLHLSMGTGVVEGWTRYLAYWLREKAQAEDDGTSPARNTSNGRPAECALQPASRRVPDELLDVVFGNISAEFGRKSLRECVRICLPLSLVCKAWKRVVEPHAWTNVVLDVPTDADVIACLDPVGGAGARLLPCIQSLDLRAKGTLSKADQQEAEGDEQEEEVDEEDQDGGGTEGEATGPAPRRPLLHGPADNEASTMLIVASVARILAKCPKLKTLSIDQYLESVSHKVFTGYDPVAIWPKLIRLKVSWSTSCIDLLPILARLSRLQQLTDLCLLLVTSDEKLDRRGTMTQELVEKYQVQPLEHLEQFYVRSFAEAPIGHKAVLQLISPRAPLRIVTWGGFMTPGLCRQLSYGTSEIKELTFTWLLPTTNLTDQLLPQLLELGPRRIKRLTLNIGPVPVLGSTQSMPSITTVLEKIPCGVRTSRATDMDPFMTIMGTHKCFPTGGADFAAIKARPTAAVTLGGGGEWRGSLGDKPLLQVGAFFVEKEMDDDDEMRLFGRFGSPDIDGDVTEWMLLRLVSADDATRPTPLPGRRGTEVEVLEGC
ncbi:hypothetical protein JCM3774_003739 [Rhodotorula dairenensis]